MHAGLYTVTAGPTASGVSVFVVFDRKGALRAKLEMDKGLNITGVLGGLGLELPGDIKSLLPITNPIVNVISNRTDVVLSGKLGHTRDRMLCKYVVCVPHARLPPWPAVAAHHQLSSAQGLTAQKYVLTTSIDACYQLCTGDRRLPQISLFQCHRGTLDGICRLV
jgi:hypothetical protein